MIEKGNPRKSAYYAIVVMLLCGCRGVQGTEQPTIRSAIHTASPVEQPPGSTAAPTHSPLPRFESASCQFINAYLYDVACGYLVVPEDRSQPDGPTVRLHVAIFKSTNPDPEPDPVIYLAGGGGVNHLDSSGYYLSHGGYEILERRDYIMYNQRGAHYNQPTLGCPDYSAFLSELAGQNLNSEDYHASKLEFLLDCRDDLVDRGINLEMYNSAVNAADLNDLRLVLGYDQVNLYGTSYGTRLALTMMRDFPEGVRSMIIDSVYPPQVDYFSEFAANAHQAYLKLFESCAVDPFCNETYPELEDVFYDVIDNLNASPSSFTWMDEPVMFNGGVFSEAIYLMLYTAEIGIAPKAIFEASRGDFAIIEPYILGAMDITTTHLSWGAYYSIHCSEEAILDTFDHALALSADLPPQIMDYYIWTGPSAAIFNFDLCTSWGVDPANNIESEPVVSDIPTLLLAGQFDPITPSDWAQLAASTLSNSYFYEFPGIGHGVMRSNRCALEIGLQFIHDPKTEPDASCVDDLTGPEFR
jgi:pimeloyl-ACP methyl ester carboxylesterase